MLRFLGWLAVGLGALGVLAVLVLLATGGETRAELRDSLRSQALDMSGGGRGFQDGLLVWQQDQPQRITIEELPSLDGRRLGASYSGGFFTDEKSLYGFTLRQLLAECLELPIARVAGDESLDKLWFDVDAARSDSPLNRSMSGWEPVHQSVVAALLESYELTLIEEERVLPVSLLRAGPGWASHEHERRRGRRGSSLTTGGSLVILENASVSEFVKVLEKNLGELELDGIDRNALCTLELRWTQGDRESLLRALAEELDIVCSTEDQRLRAVVITGVPVSLHSQER
ncbi:MAG: hypothetical protein ACI9EF_000721 [Pseudohongiellaceae bacterium]